MTPPTSWPPAWPLGLFVWALIARLGWDCGGLLFALVLRLARWAP